MIVYYSNVNTPIAVVFYLACAWRSEEDDMGRFELAWADDSYSQRKSSGEAIVENKIYKNDWLLFYVMCKD